MQPQLDFARWDYLPPLEQLQDRAANASPSERVHLLANGAAFAIHTVNTPTSVSDRWGCECVRDNYTTRGFHRTQASLDAFVALVCQHGPTWFYETDSETVRESIASLKGWGWKTASMALAFAGRKDCPAIDRHVARYAGVAKGEKQSKAPVTKKAYVALENELFGEHPKGKTYAQWELFQRCYKPQRNVGAGLATMHYSLFQTLGIVN